MLPSPGRSKLRSLASYECCGQVLSVVVHSLIVSIIALCLFSGHVAIRCQSLVAMAMHARPQEKVGEDPVADVAIAGQKLMARWKQVEEPCLL